VSLTAAAPVLQDEAILAAPCLVQQAMIIQMRSGMGPKGAREGTFPEANNDSEGDIPEEGLRQPEAPAISDEDALHAALADMLRPAEANGASQATMVALIEIVFKYQDVFRLELGKDPPANAEPLRIELIEDDSLSRTPRAQRFAPLQMEFISEHVDMLVRLGVVKPSNSDFASPIVLARKKDGSWRLCVDLRLINSKTKPLRWPLPKIHELLPHLAGAAVFASLDLLRGFWQFPLDPASTRYWAFITHHGLFEFERVVMGGGNSAP
jgi:hypothetical protein